MGFLDKGDNPRLATQKVFDWALPQDWVDDFYQKMGVYPAACGMFVWSYDEAKTWGKAFPLTDEAERLLNEYERQAHA